MAIPPNGSAPRPQVLVVSPAYLQEKYLAAHPLATAQGRVALAFYIPHQNQILITRFYRTLLAHELAHYFTFHYLSAARSDWEAIADKVVAAERSADGSTSMRWAYRLRWW
jgi:tRNA isopentenyl-2-thiomethyl-A-37 hydroxylase MiaE